MRYGVWLLMFAKRNRRKPAVDEVPSANREMGAGTNETRRSPLLFFCCTDVDEGTDFVLS